jgi:predicted small lipoprotein YifL
MTRSALLAALLALALTACGQKEEAAPVEEAPIVEEVAPVEEAPIVEEVAPVEEAPIVEEVPAEEPAAE